MQPVQLQNDKLELIEWITQLEDIVVVKQLTQIMEKELISDFMLSDEQKF